MYNNLATVVVARLHTYIAGNPKVNRLPNRRALQQRSDSVLICNANRGRIRMWRRANVYRGVYPSPLPMTPPLPPPR